MTTMRRVQKRRSEVFGALQAIEPATATQVAEAMPGLRAHHVRNALRELASEGVVAATRLTMDVARQIASEHRNPTTLVYSVRYENGPCCRLCERPLTGSVEGASAPNLRAHNQ